MNDQSMILILVMAFFMLGCRFSCKGMKEHFPHSDKVANCPKNADGTYGGCNKNLCNMIKNSKGKTMACSTCPCWGCNFCKDFKAHR